jgi:surfeit locus 1 family protein
VKQAKQMLRTLFGRKWWWVTLLVMVAMLVLARLGVWQLDRLDQRRAKNTLIAAALAASPLDLAHETLPDDLSTLKNRQVATAGTYDFDNQIVLKVQNWEGRAGAHLITPLLLEGGEKAVLIDRGWIPEADNNPVDRAKFDVPGRVTVEGYVVMSEALLGREIAAPEERQTEWYRVDIAAIQQQIPYELLPIYVMQAPEDSQELPYRPELVVDLSEGSHLGYALQWFTFSLGLCIAYVIYVRKSMKDGDST